MNIYSVEDWIKNTLNSSHNEWVICVFNIRGTFKDVNGISRNIVNELTLPKFIKSVDWTISSIRRKYKNNSMKFIPFFGGGKDIQKSFHIHAFIEKPYSVDYWTFNDNLKKYFRQYASRAYKSEVTDELWIQPLNKSLIANHTHYCTRYEDNTFYKGSEKVLFECNSCLL